ncbi:MAG: hypothetical protein IKL06_08465 [Lachnospiraceae bacterium]|nr:hypothetical protein [Lachnospiraceae bacterium]
MGFFKSWLNKRKEKKLEERFEEISEGVLLEEDKNNSSKVEHYVIERLEQVVEATREIEEEKSEYRVVTAYLNDIHTIGGLPEKERAAITDVAQNIVNLDRARQEFLHSEKKISDVQYTAIQQEENTVPNTIKRLKANEAYQAVLEKDMKYLVRERDEWLFYKEELLNEEKTLQNNVRLVTGLGICSGVLLLLYQFATDASMKLIWTVYLFIMAAAICTLALKIMNAQRDYQRATRNADKAIQLLNTVKLKYVSVTNAVDYCREKFHVNSAGEFNRIWEAYLEAVKQREKFEINNDDLRYYNNRLIRMLSEYKLYDAKVWIPQALALVDHNEMVEVTHRLNERRQKIRGRIEKSVELIKRHVEDMEKLLPDLSPDVAAQVKNIMVSIEKLGVTR